jgi:DNA-binding response OmpR family regulator
VKILLVEDEANLDGYLKKGLEEEGHEIAIAHNCEEAREIGNPNQFEMVLLGLILPDGSGIQLASDLKKVEPQLPIVILKIREEEIRRISEPFFRSERACLVDGPGFGRKGYSGQRNRNDSRKRHKN